MALFKDQYRRRDFLRYLAHTGGMFALGAMPGAAALAAQAGVRGIRVSSTGERGRLVIELESSLAHKVFSLNDPPRLVVDVIDSVLASQAPSIAPGRLIRGVRSGKHRGNTRIVLDLQQAVASKSFQLEAGRDGSPYHRLVVDLEATGVAPSAAGKEGSKRVETTREDRPLRNLVVAIDAGHGGRDSGAVGRKRTKEKNITLQISKLLQRELNAMKGIEAVLTRDRDRFVGLRERTRIARTSKADLFISIHADAFVNPSAKGASVYTLSTRGATSEAAKLLAKRENESLSGVSLTEQPKEVAKILIDLAQSATTEYSLSLGKIVLQNLAKVGPIHKKKVEQANFAVLKSLDIPSILVETAFISNPGDERRLRDKKQQARMVGAISKGISQYLRKQAPPGTILSGRKHSDLSLNG